VCLKDPLKFIGSCTAQSLSGKPARREDFGLPHNWARVKSWINFRGDIRLKKTEISGQKI
jgi:hypothetical protein